MEHSEEEFEDAFDIAEAASFKTKIVGCNYYNGHVLPGENVYLVREPRNPYDSNAIKVMNLNNVQVGHIPRTVAMYLAPMIDRSSPPLPQIGVEGSVAGDRLTYHIPLTLHVLAPADKRNVVIEHLRQKGLLKQAEYNRHIRALERENSLSRTGPPARQPLAQVDEGTWRDIMSGLQANKVTAKQGNDLFEQLGNTVIDLEKMPMAPQPLKYIETQLLDYQKQGLQWMLDAENPKLPESGETVQFWKKESLGGSAKMIYRNILTYTPRDLTDPPVLAKGAILADDMGLGKTLQILSLVASTKDVPSAPGYSQTTLVVVPLSVINNWTKQIESHVRRDGEGNPTLSYYVAHGPGRNMAPSFLTNFDIVFTTYNIISLYASAKKPKDHFLSIKWRRCILDEGHIIRSMKTNQSKAACALDAYSRFIITGTPIQNSLRDLFSLVKFLRLEPFTELGTWDRTFTRPVKAGTTEGVQRLKLLMQLMSLRRTKDMKFNGKPIIPLPEKEVFIHRLDFQSDKERQLYTALNEEFRRNYKAFSSNSDSASVSFTHVFEVLVRLRQACNSTGLVSEQRALTAISLLDAFRSQSESTLNMKDPRVKQLLNMLWEGSGDECAICLDDLKDVVITRCAHYFCRECIKTVCEVQGKCPLCREVVRKDELIELPPPSRDDDEADTEEGEDFSQHHLEKEEVVHESTKINALRDFLSGFINRDPSTKAVVFSQWTTMLSLVEPVFQRTGISYVRFDGSMSRKKRDSAVQLFQEGRCHAILCSLKAASFGLNLTAANQVYLLDSSYNPTVESQAFDRVFRLGQTRKVNIFRFVIRNTIEERILEIQENKKELARHAFGTKKKADSRLEDVKALFDQSNAFAEAKQSGKPLLGSVAGSGDLPINAARQLPIIPHSIEGPVFVDLSGDGPVEFRPLNQKSSSSSSSSIDTTSKSVVEKAGATASGSSTTVKRGMVGDPWVNDASRNNTAEEPAGPRRSKRIRTQASRLPASPPPMDVSSEASLEIDTEWRPDNDNSP